MKWLNYFLNFNIPFYIYKLNINDSIIFSKNINTNQPMIILYGIVYIIKNFDNNKKTTIAILGAENILYINSMKDDNCYYRIIAINKSFLISFQWKNLININRNLNHLIFKELIRIYIKTNTKYEMMNIIMSHKYVKNRVIQLLLLYALDFGNINKKDIKIPHYISQYTIGKISGTTRTTANRILRNLNYTKFIKYSTDKKISINIHYFYIAKMKNI
uniref:global nitrogen transcriptional regulator n=1 Tax=Hypnea cervicornis TaxID=387623 RepID=UPI0021B61CD3|nr:global nitrogen transcriptional regulator [Hypnea cervicornis]UVW80649.1 global nitrogen transcriptional regulator [Hypnea cervicornis]